MSLGWLRSRRLWIVLGTLVLLSAAYTLGGFYGVPRLADHLIRSQVEALGHRVELGPIRFHPFRFEAQVEQLRLSEASGAPLIGFGKLDVDLEVWESLRARGAVLRHLRLDAPDIALVVEADGQVNLARLLPPSTEPDPTTEGEAKIPHLRIGELAIREGRVGIEDLSRPERFALELRPVSFELQDFRTTLGHANAVAFSGEASTGERIRWSGAFTVQPLGSTGQFAIENAQATTASAYLQDQLPLRLLSGVAETAGEYQLSLDPELALDVRLPMLTVRELALAEFGSSPPKPTVSVEEIAIAEIAVSLAQREVRVGGVDVRGLRTTVRRNADGSLNLARLLAPAAPTTVAADAPADSAAPTAAAQAETSSTATDRAPDEAPPAPPWRATLDGLRVHAANVSAEDGAVKPALRLALSPLDLELGAVSSDLQEPIAIKAGLGIGKRGRLDAKGTLEVQPLAAQFELDARRLDMSIFQPYLAELGAVELRSAELALRGALNWAQTPSRLAFDGEVKLADLALRDGERSLDLQAAQLGARGILRSAPSPAGVRFEGDAQLAGLSLKSRKQGDELVSWRELRVTGLGYAQQHNRLRIERVDLVAPKARVEISPEREINLVQAFAAPNPVTTSSQLPKPPATTAPAETSAALAFELKSLRVQDGELDFADRSIDPQFAASIAKLQGRIDGLSSRAEASATVELKGQVDEFSPVLITGTLNPLAYDRDTTLALSFRNMDLVRFNPYSGRFAGYNIEKGKLTTELTYRIQQRALQAEHHVIVDQLEFGEATGSKDAVPLPIKLAVALLKDRNGTIDLQLPVSGDLDDPTFRVGPLVWKVFVNVLTKAVAAPFAALGQLFGGGEELQFVEFAPGQATLDDAQKSRLDQLARALIERPQLKLDVPYALDEARDGEAMATTALAREFALLPPAASDEVRLEILSALHQRRLGLRPVFANEAADLTPEARTAARLQQVEGAVLASLMPDAIGLEALAADRARAVQAALLARPDLAPERIFLTSRRTGSLDEAGRVRMELKLE